MNKLTKVGLTALASSLVVSSASAGELGVSGSWSWSYDDSDGTALENGNPMSMGDSVTFSGSGETDQGWTAGVSYELDGGNFDDYKLTLDMGDSGSLTFSGASVTGSGIHMVNNIIPAADTAVQSMTAATTAYGIARGAGATGNLGYTITVGDIKASAEMTKGAGTDRSYGIQYTGVENLTVVAGMGDVNPGNTDGGSEEHTMGIKYAVGGATLAYQVTEVDYKAANGADEDAVAVGVSFAVNDDLTVSYGRQKVDITGQGQEETNSGLGVSYTMGSMSVAAYAGKTENSGGSAAASADEEGKGLTLSISF